MSTKNMNDFNIPAPLPGDDSNVFIKLTYRRIPRYKLNRLDPKDARWLDDDVITPMEAAVYGDSL